MKQTTSNTQFVICTRNDGYAASLEIRKVYPVIPDSGVAKHHLIRIVDESGEDYVYPQAYFVAIELPQAAVDAFAVAA